MIKLAQFRQLDPFNSFIYRNSLKLNSINGLDVLKDWKIGVKDNVAVKGWPLTCASKSLNEHIAPYSADVVEALMELGGEIVGKVNMDEFGMGSRGERSWFGPTLNPLDPTKSPGGSSSGCAAAIAGGLCRLAIGSDTGGSVRLPASYSGIVGFKPTWGVISRLGLVSYAPSLDTVGFMTRSVDDVITCFEGLLGESRTKWRDPTLVSMKGNELSAVEPLPLEGVTIGILDEWLEALKGVSSHPIEAIVASLENKSGARLKLVSIPELKGSECLERYYEIACMEASSTLARYTGSFLKEVKSGDPYMIKKGGKNDYIEHVKGYQGEYFGEEVLQRIEKGRQLLGDGANLRRTEGYRAELRTSFDRLFKEECCDVLLGPTAFSTAPNLSGNLVNKIEKDDDLFTVPANLASLPAISLPLHGIKSGTDGVIGTQLMAAHLDDRLLLRVAKGLERFYVNEKRNK